MDRKRDTISSEFCIIAIKKYRKDIVTIFNLICILSSNY